MRTDIPEEIWWLIAADRRRVLTDEEKRTASRWLKNNSDAGKELKELRQLVAEYEMAISLHSIDEKEAWKKIDSETTSYAGWKCRKRFVWQWAVAAVILPVLCTSIFLYYYHNSTERRAIEKALVIRPGTYQAELLLPNGESIHLKEAKQQQIVDRTGQIVGIDSSNIFVYRETEKPVEEWNTLRIPLGGEYQLILADGTKVWLNSGSELKFPVKFNEKERRIKLYGEAFFEVKKDEGHPFIVETIHSDIRVTGTSFNVCSYPEDRTEQTTLVEGTVAVKVADQIYDLTPGRLLQLNIKDRSVQISEVDVQLFCSWKEGIFRFCDMPLEDLATKLYRWYNVPFFFQSPECKNARFTGAIPKDVNINDFIPLIETTTHVKFEIRENGIIIQKK